jgi:hypothetical protein
MFIRRKKMREMKSSIINIRKDIENYIDLNRVAHRQTGYATWRLEMLEKNIDKILERK